MEKDTGRNNKLTILEVPGLAEKRPSVLRGDSVRASLSHQPTHKRVVFKGIALTCLGRSLTLLRFCSLC